MVPTYQAPGKIFYEARMEGVDPGWVHLEEAHVRYAGLGAGRHVLDIRGVIPGVLEGPTRSLPFYIIPAWWETLWARILGAVAGLGALWALFWLRHLALQARNRQLQEEVARQTRALQEASRAKSAFLANMSHELRTPLNAILLYSELLQEEAKEKGLTTSTADAMKITQAGSSLLKLIDDILDISKIEAGHIHIEMEEIALEPFLDRLDSSLRPVVERKSNQFVVRLQDAPRTLVSDSTRLQQILANLLGNAAKFTENGQVTLTASEEAHWVVFRVEDTGIGMTTEEQSKVFGEFVQADSSTTRKYGGTGLGLTLVLRLTELLRGRVDLHSSPGVGTRVTVRIPARESPVG
jgi:signal transduction histidine kinase